MHKHTHTQKENILASLYSIASALHLLMEDLIKQNKVFNKGYHFSQEKKALKCHKHSCFQPRSISVWPTLSSWESGCSKLCCWMAIGGGRGTASAPSSPSSSPQLCMPEEEDLDRVPLLSPSLRIRWRDRRRLFFNRYKSFLSFWQSLRSDDSHFL